MMFQEIAPHKFDITYRPEATLKAKESDLLLIVERGSALVSCEVIETSDNSSVISNLEIPTVREIEGFLGEDLRSEGVYLFELDNHIRVYGIIRKLVIPTDLECSGYRLLSSRDLRNVKPMWQSYAACVGINLIGWYRSTQFCSCCGKPLKHSATERAMVCSDSGCRHTVYPSICPSVIVLIRDGNRALLTRYAAAHSQYRRYALVAGYVETGEMPEETVKREVWEEVGLKVKNIQYYRSQPWPISGALLLGYVCDLDGSNQVKLDESELEVAEWLTREEMPNRAYDVSLTSELMEQFRTGKL